MNNAARDLFSNLKLGAEALESKDRAAMNLAWNKLVGQLDLEIKGNDRHVELAKGMITKLQNAMRG